LRVVASAEPAVFKFMNSGFSSCANFSAIFSQTGTYSLVSPDAKKERRDEAAHMISRMIEKIAMQLGVLLQHFAQVDDDARLVALRKGRGWDCQTNEAIQNGERCAHGNHLSKLILESIFKRTAAHVSHDTIGPLIDIGAADFGIRSGHDELAREGDKRLISKQTNV
jgi:hypothetical protein